MYVDLDNPTILYHVISQKNYFLNRDKLSLFYVYFHMQPSWNIHAIGSTLFKGHAPKLFFQCHFLTSVDSNSMCNITWNSHFE